MAWTKTGTLRTPGELAYAEVSGSSVYTNVSGSLTYVPISGAGITVPISTLTVWIQYSGEFTVATAGGGTVYLVLTEMTSGSMVVIDSSPRAVLSTNSGLGSKNIGNITGSRRIGPVTSPRVFQLYGVQYLDTSSALACQIVNTTTNPTWIGAFAR